MLVGLGYGSLGNESTRAAVTKDVVGAPVLEHGCVRGLTLRNKA
jgi:hypothetical protein